MGKKALAVPTLNNLSFDATFFFFFLPLGEVQELFDVPELFARKACQAKSYLVRACVVSVLETHLNLRLTFHVYFSTDWQSHSQHNHKNIFLSSVTH